MSRDADDDNARPKIPRGPTRAGQRAGLLFHNAVRGFGRDACRWTYAGVVPASGVPRVRTSCIGQRFEDWQRCCYRHHTKARLLKADRVVAVCATGALCGDKRHLFCVPGPKLPKAPRPPRFNTAAFLAAIAADAAAAALLPTASPSPSTTTAGP